jgi:hypothetical protein
MLTWGLFRNERLNAASGGADHVAVSLNAMPVSAGPHE